MTRSLDDALALALQLSPGDRLRLVERVVASVEREIAEDQPSEQPPAEEHWGRSLNQLLDRLDLSAWESLDINDPVAWVKAQRERDESRYEDYWKGKK